MATTVTWVLDANSKYEVSSREHLIQIMHDGAIYTNAGDVPTPPDNLWGRADYIQTAEIDLLGDSTNIRSMGYSSNWAGEYDGNGFTVSNWVYVEESFPSPTTTVFHGFFSHINNGTVKNFRLAGVCSLSGFNDGGGFICDRVLSGTVSNIEVDLSPGSFIEQSATQTGSMSVAPVFGRLESSGVTTGITFKGQIDSITVSGSASNVYLGGLVGWLRNSSGTNTLFRNLGTFPGGLTGNWVGGVVGLLTNSNLTKALNAMTGDITNIAAGNSYIGGVIGELGQNSTSLTNNEFVNSMTGNITGDSFAVGGVIGRHLQESGSTVHSLFNYMTGDVTNTANDRVGGMIADGDSNTNITTSINAMSGHVRYPTTGDIVTAGAEANIDTSFGLTYEVERNITTTPLGLPTDPATGLPVFDLTSTDPDNVTYTFDFVFGNIPPPVEWVLDANSKYEISSKEHLIQLMNEGTLFENTGTVPTDWRLSSYIQTTDIDLLGDSTDIVPIWCGGGYDGNGFTVFNWVYVEPSYPSTPTVDHVGFFDRTYSNAVVKNFRMAGVCSISGFKTQAAFVSSYFLESSSVYNIEVDLSPGSFIQNTNSSSFNTRIGGVCAYIATTGTVTDVTLKGELTITPSTNANTASTMGGIAGDIANSGPCTLLRNLATFPNPLKGQLAGGITGRIYRTSVTKVLNAMTGDITQNPVGSYIGGIAGLVIQNVVSETSEFVNSMKGNITCNATNSHCAGMFGYLVQDSGATIHSMFNYMTGDITNTFSSSNAAGLVSLGNANTNLTTSINAMNGQVRMPTTNEPSSDAESNIDILFGLTYDIERNITTTPLGLPTDPEVGLPIFDFIATDPDSVVHTFEFVFGNLPRVFNQFQITSADVYISMAELEIYDMTGTNIALLGTASSNASTNASHAPRGNDGNTDPNYSSGTVTDLHLSTGGVTWTLDLDREYTLAEINKVVFYNRSTSQARAIGSTIAFNSPDGGAPEQVGVLTSDSIQEFVVTPAPEFLLPTPRVSSISATVVEVAGAFAYRITVTDVAAGTISTAHNGISTGDVTIRRLSPETNYVLQLFANSGSGYELVDTENVTTLANSPSNYDKTTFGSNGKFDLTALDDSSFALLGEVMNDVFTTGEELEINIGARKSKVAFVKRGESVSTDDSILAPFSSTAGSGQAFTMNLSDSSEVSVAYDETDNSLDIGGATVQVGGSIVIDGKKLTANDV